MQARLAFADGHCHSNPVTGLGASAIAKRFKKKGGWFIAFVSLPPHHYGIKGGSIDSYRKSYEIVVKEAERAREEGVKTRVFLGFHPAEVDEYYRQGMSLKDIVELGFKALDLALDLIRKGLADGIGEVGRQHYSTAPDRYVASELIMIHALEIARDHGVPLHLHLEQGGYTTAVSIAKLADTLRCPRSLVFLHHSTVSEGVWAEELGLWYTVPGKYKTLKKVFEKGLSRGLIPESDFIDDPRRPGVSSYPWEIIDNQRRLLRERLVDEETLYKINIDNITRAYGVSPP